VELMADDWRFTAGLVRDITAAAEEMTGKEEEIRGGEATAAIAKERGHAGQIDESQHK
jgi:hypothetical protein